MTPQRRAEDGQPKIRVTVAVALQVIAWVVGVMMTYGAVNARVSVIESKQGESDKRLERIEQKLDRVLEQHRP